MKESIGIIRQSLVEASKALAEEKLEDAQQIFEERTNPEVIRFANMVVDGAVETISGTIDRSSELVKAKRLFDQMTTEYHSLIGGAEGSSARLWGLVDAKIQAEGFGVISSRLTAIGDNPEADILTREYKGRITSLQRSGVITEAAADYLTFHAGNPFRKFNYVSIEKLAQRNEQIARDVSQAAPGANKENHHPISGEGIRTRSRATTIENPDEHRKILEKEKGRMARKIADSRGLGGPKGRE